MFYTVIAAIALVLIFEGILPFLSPNTWRHMVAAMSCHSDLTLRITGLICMLLGVVLLFIAHRYI
jgi:uncharacterized protein YjeT (DUF2065 family)